MESMWKNNGNEKKCASKLPDRKYGYFRDDQITFLVTHQDNEVHKDQLLTFSEGISNYLKQIGGGIVAGTPQAISFPKFTNEEHEQCHQDIDQVNEVTITGAFSIIKCTVRDAPDDPINQLHVIEMLTKDLQGKPIGEFIVEGASPNWLTSVVSQGAGTGGPGGIPSPYYGSRKNAPYGFYDLIEKLDGVTGLSLYGRGEGVDVAILDTAPSAHDLVAAYKEWHDHPLIRNLLGPHGKLHLYPADYYEALRLGNTSLNGSDYKVTDHGLFIAGIIHSIVPEANIHLIEVLNQYGVGDFTAFTLGLQKVASDIYDPTRKLVINCSWMLDFPGDDFHCDHPNLKHKGVLIDPDLEFEREVRAFAKRDQATLRTLEVLFNRFAVQGRGAIAAAGNDAYDNEDDGTSNRHVRPLARYPAALTEVTGVGALPITLERFTSGKNKGKYRTSNFSNRSDRPEVKGIATLGGEQGEGKGILGLYIGEFPDGRLNTSKWAWWAGTSFATPILTGAVASALSSPRQPGSTQNALEELRREGVINGLTDINEEVLAITQC
jgi:hypothetical protein